MDEQRQIESKPYPVSSHHLPSGVHQPHGTLRMPVQAGCTIRTAPPHINLELARRIRDCKADPLRFVLFAFLWGEPGTSLEQHTGPDTWQAEFLRDLREEVRQRNFNGAEPVKAIRMAVSSGHGIGKSILVAWLVLWIMSTRPHARGTITANSLKQLETKTWAQIREWGKLAINAHWFTVLARSLFFSAHPETWACSIQTCRVENSEAFAGQHAADSTSFYVFDEASGIHDAIFEVAEGGLTDGEPMIFLFGNPTQNSGKFHRVVFGAERGRWNSRTIDSRQSSLTNKQQIAEWIEDFGENSDFVRVRVRGLAPNASDLQYIDSALVAAAQKRQADYLPNDALIVGMDVARGGSDATEIRFRRSLDARSIPPIRISGEESRDTMQLAARLVEVLNTSYDGIKPTVAFVDAGMGGAIVDRCHQLGYLNAIEVNFGDKSPDSHYANMRSYMWSHMRDWLERGAIDNSPQLEIDLTGPQYHHNRYDQLVLESKDNMKQRGLGSPDGGDALALTFAAPIDPLPDCSGGPNDDEEDDLDYSGWSPNRGPAHGCDKRLLRTRIALGMQASTPTGIY